MAFGESPVRLEVLAAAGTRPVGPRYFLVYRESSETCRAESPGPKERPCRLCFPGDRLCLCRDLDLDLKREGYKRNTNVRCI